NINIKELPTNSMTATAGSEQSASGNEGPAKNVLDNNTSTIWHTVWGGTPYSNQWIAFHLNERTAVSGLKILPRQSGTNGIITKYEIYAKDGADAEWVLITSGDWAGNSDWKTTFFDTVYATDIKLQTVASMTDSGKSFSSAAEIRLLAPKEIPVNKDALTTLVEENRDRVEADYTPESWAIFAGALADAEAILIDGAATQQQVDNAYTALETAIEGLVPAANPDAPVVTGAPESGASRGTVVLTADKTVTWIVNGVETDRASDTLRLSDEGSYSVVAVDAEGNRSEEIVFAIDRTKPTLTATCEHYGYTNQDVTFTADEDVTFFNASEQIGEGAELVLTESGVYNIRAIDKAGNYTAYYRVTIIKEAPVLTGVPESGYARGSVTLRSDSKVIFTVNGVAAEDYGYGLRIIEEGAYTVKAVDMAGNETEVSFTIDNTKPTFTATVPSGQLTNEDITLTANENVNFVVGGVTVATGTEYTITQSGLTVVYVYDLAGNYGGGYKANIDKAAPVLTAVIEGTQAPVANGGYVQQGVTVKASEKSRFIVNDGEPTEIANFVKLRAEGAYTVKAVDELGNESEPFVVVIDKTAPVISSDDIVDGKAVGSVSIQANEEVLFTVDGEVAEAYAAEIVVKGDGEHTVTAVDKARNPSNELRFTIASPQKVEISPVPQSIEYLSMGGMKITDEVNIVTHGEIDEATMPRLEEALTANGYSFTKSEAAVEGKTNILLTSDKEHCAACSADLGIADMSAAEQKEGYVLQVSGGKITIVGADADGVFYGVVTLADILEQAYAEKTVAEVNICDYPEIGTRGFIEGFYGYPWSHTDRMDLMEFGSEQKMNTYIYAPKDDPYHRAQWRELYPEKEAAQIAELAQAGHENNYNFVWTIHPGDSINFNSEADVEACKTKLQQLYDLGVRQFGIMFDDVGSGSMQQHANFINRIDTEFVKAKGDVKPIITVGKRYCQAWGDSMYSFRSFVDTLHDDIEIMWTGAATMSNISKEVFDWPKQQTGTSRDFMVWWNYPVNDYCDAKVLMGPMKNLNPNLDNVTGFVSNPMNQAHASMQALYGIADYTWNTDAYDYNRAFEGSFREIAPEVAEDLQVFASNSCYLKDDGGASGAFLFEESWYLKEDIEAIRRAGGGEDPTAYAEKLIPEFQKMIEACENIKTKCENEALVKELDPFLDALKLLGEAGVASMKALNAAQAGDFEAWEPNSMEAVAKIAEMENCKVDRLKDNKPQRFTVDVGTQILKPFIVEMASESAYIIGAEEKPTEYDYSQAYVSDNIALSSLGVSATASSSTGWSEGADKAIDGRIRGSKWCSTVARPYLTLDLGSEKTIKEYQIINCGHPEAGESVSWNTKSAQVLASNDGVTFTVVDEFDGNKDDVITRILAEPVTARYIRLQILEPNQGSVDGSGATRIYEFRLYDKVHAQQSIKIQPADVEIANNEGATDTVTVNNLKEGDIVSLYTSIEATEPFAVSAPVAAGETSVTMENLELKAAGGRIYMTCTNKSYLPSVKTSKGYAAE
ncbi:MAG: beta-N-acetylglucosaminidase domain-containing protein, partial [Oscillospiraceae bacterium]